MQPAPTGALATPTDNFVPPDLTDLWLHGRVEGSDSGKPPAEPQQTTRAAEAAESDASYGHILK